MWRDRPDVVAIPPEWSSEGVKVPVTTIVMHRRRFEDPDPVYCLLGACSFVSAMVNAGGIDPSYIAGPAKHFCKLSYYFGQVNNGGHGQYVENSRLNAMDVEHCISGLMVVEAWDHLARYKRMLTLCGQAGQDHNLRNGAFNATAEMKSVDDGWFRISKEQNVAGHVKSYLSKQPDFHLAEEEDYLSTMMWLVEETRRQIAAPE